MKGYCGVGRKVLEGVDDEVIGGDRKLAKEEVGGREMEAQKGAAKPIRSVELGWTSGMLNDGENKN